MNVTEADYWYGQAAAHGFEPTWRSFWRRLWARTHPKEL